MATLKWFQKHVIAINFIITELKVCFTPSQELCKAFLASDTKKTSQPDRVYSGKVPFCNSVRVSITPWFVFMFDNNHFELATSTATAFSQHGVSNKMG